MHHIQILSDQTVTMIMTMVMTGPKVPRKNSSGHQLIGLQKHVISLGTLIIASTVTDADLNILGQLEIEIITKQGPAQQH